VKVDLIAAAEDRDWSLASFHTTEKGDKTTLLRRGSALGSKTITYIGWDRVWLTDARGLCQTRLFADAPAAAQAHKTAAPAVDARPNANAGGGTGELVARVRKGIRKNGPNDFDVERSVLETVMERYAELIGNTRVMPERDGGRVAGYKMGLPKGSLLEELGFQNGDRLEAFNGLELTDPAKALEAFAKVQSGADTLSITVRRDGRPTQIDFHVK
jgi:general secretion pathway protein C